MNKKHHLLDRLVSEKIVDIHAGYRKYQLIIKKGLSDNGSKCFGLVDFDKGVLYLERGMDHETARETLVHELCHIVLELSGLGGDEESGMIKPHNNEEITTLISRGFLMLVNLNPELFEIINERP